MSTYLFSTSIETVTVTFLTFVACWLAPFITHVFENGQALHEVGLS